MKNIGLSLLGMCVEVGTCSEYHHNNNINSFLWINFASNPNNSFLKYWTKI